MKPEKPITRKEMYLDVATGGSTELPSPVTREEKYLAKIAGESVDIPTPVTRYEMLLAAVAGESYTLTPVTRLEIYLAKAAGQDVEIPQPVTREEMYWFDYCGGTPTPPEREYTGAVPVTFIADGTPLLDFLISGNTVQSGTPTPDNPIMPEGTGERTGNLFNVNRLPSDTWTVDDKYYIDGAVGDSKSNIQPDTVDVSISNSGDLTVTARSYYGAGFVIPVTPNTTYTISFTTDTAVPSSKTIATITYVNADEDFLNYITIYGGTTSVPFTTPNTAYYIIITFRYASNTITYSNIMLNSGSTALPYEPFGYKIPISSANTTTPVYLGEVESTRNIKKLVLTGGANEDLRKNNQDPSNYLYYLRLTVDNIGARDCLCTHLMWRTGAPTDSIGCNANLPRIIYMNFGADIMDAQTSGNTVEGLKEYLAAQYAAGTPVTVWYVLATETTGIVNEPLMRIGDYADTLSMEQAGVQIPTANGSTTLDVETTVKPSEVYIKYRGEAVGTLSTLSAEVSSPEATEEVNPEETEETENGSEDVSLQYKPEAIE